MTLTRQQFYYLLGKASVGIDDSIPLKYYELESLIKKELECRLVIEEDIENLADLNLVNLELIYSGEDFLNFLSADGRILSVIATGHKEPYLAVNDCIYYLFKKDILAKLMPLQVVNEYITLQKTAIEEKMTEKQRKTRLAEYKKLKAEFEPLSESRNE